MGKNRIHFCLNSCTKMKQKEIIVSYFFSISTTLLQVQHIAIEEIWKNYPVVYLSILLINICMESIVPAV